MPAQRWWQDKPHGVNVAKSIRHSKCKSVNRNGEQTETCTMCNWHDKIRDKIQELINDGCPIGSATIKWYSTDKYAGPDGKFNTYIESMIYGSEGNKPYEEVFTSIITYYKSSYPLRRGEQP